MKQIAVVLALVVSATTYAQSPAFSRGEHVRVKVLDPNGPPATAMVLTIVGLPNDRLSVTNGRVYVNDVRLEQFSRDFIERVAAAPERIPPRVPAGHYFVMGEHRINENISEYWGQHAAGSLETAR
jgi:signal peptidase I